MPKFKLASKTAIFLLAMCLSTSLAVGWMSYLSSKNTLEPQTLNNLTAIQAAKTAEIERYFEQIAHQIQTLSENPTTIAALKEFAQAYSALQQGSDAAALNASALTAPNSPIDRFYREIFLPELSQAMNASTTVTALGQLDIAALMPRDPAASYLQHHYIAANANAAGEKHLLARAINDNSGYADTHADYHPTFRSFLEKFSYYDIFLVDSQNGDIVYSVSKETDFGTSLKTGPYRNSNLAKAFQLANQPDLPSDTFFVDFEPYLPSFNAPAAFIASPIYTDGQQLGELIFQIPVNRINDVMTGGEQWSEQGLGESGETYLVGPDFTIRSASRFFSENPEGYLKSLEGLGYPAQKLAQLRRYKTSILNQNVNTDAALYALAGERGTRIIEDYRKVAVLSSYGPLDFGEARWAVIAELDTKEAFTPVRALQQVISIWAIAISLVVVALGIWAARTITQPIVALTDAAKVVGSGDIIEPLQRQSDDEIGELTTEFNQMVSDLHEQQITIDQQTAENHQLLLNVLLEPIAIRLKNGEVNIADAFPSVSVLFTDIVGFTEMSRAVPPITILRMLDDLFGAFDQAALDLGVEKIKTIGDSYMAVCGLPYPNEAHADQIAKLSLAILDCLKFFNEQNGTRLKMRLGAHSGAVVAGVVGTSKFSSDLWGDTVNMASRMESTSLPDRIQVSDAFRENLREPYDLEFRGELQIKGAGLVTTYFLSTESQNG